MESYIAFSLALSNAEVASSKSKILGFLNNTQAIAILCFYPPESYPP
jgi:hypothetical protein